MTLLTLGISHRTAPVELRERVAITDAQLPDRLGEALGELPVSELAILSTCNRTEYYCVQPERDPAPLLRWIAEHHTLSAQALEPAVYHHWDRDAALHTMRVAAGLDSMVLGEPQILGQLKSAWSVARSSGTLGPQLDRLAQHTLAVAKDVRTRTEIGRHSVSVAYAAVQLARQIFADLSDTTAMMLGAGETIELVMRHLIGTGVRRFLLVNRTLHRAVSLAQRMRDAHGDDLEIETLALQALPEHLARADLLIASTGADLPVIGKGMVERAIRARRHAPMFMVDLAVPRDIEHEVADLSDIYLYSVDDLAGIVDANRRQRDQAAKQADALIHAGADRFMADLRTRSGDSVIRDLRETIETVRVESHAEALARLRAGEPPEKVLEQFGRRLTNRVLHQPSVRLREALQTQDHPMIDSARRLFSLDAEPGAETNSRAGVDDRRDDADDRTP